MLKKAMQKGVVATLLVSGLLLTAAAPAALAQDRNCRRGNYRTSAYYGNDYYDRGRNYDYYNVQDRNSRRRSRDYDDYYDRRDRRESNREVLRDVGIGAAAGAGGGVLLGGKKGALIGAAIGAAGGYVYNRGKRNRW
jgi:hypothetical protein